MSITWVTNPVQTLKQKFISSLGLPFRDLRPESTIIEVLAAEKIPYRRRLFDPFVSEFAV